MFVIPLQTYMIVQFPTEMASVDLDICASLLCGNLWARSLLSQRVERNEWLLLHEFHRNGYIVPERLTNCSHYIN